MDLQLLQDIDIIIGCVDNLEARAAINAFALKESKIYKSITSASSVSRELPVLTNTILSPI